MQWTILDFIEKEYDITPRLRAKYADPIKRIEEEDDLPFDEIKCIDGDYLKVVYINDDNYITVIDLLSYRKEDVEKMEPSDFKDTYIAYMQNVTIEEGQLEFLMTTAREYKKTREHKKELVEA